jgi:hypothetical protein
MHKPAISAFNQQEAMMSQEKLIREIAQSVLARKNVSASVKDGWLWGRTQRLLRNVEAICSLPELADADLPVDRFCLTAAVYFSESWLCAENSKLTVSTGSGDSGKLAAQVAAEKLEDVISQQKINKIGKIIVESGNKLTKMTEAKVLSDARNLDDLGAVGIFNQFRKSTLQGKGATESLQGWQKKVDYGYWQARLKESFHFESAKKIAQKRFSVTQDFMARLDRENAAADIE